MVKPTNFDPIRNTRLCFLYRRTGFATAPDSYGVGRNREYVGNMANDGYIYMSLDNRGGTGT